VSLKIKGANEKDGQVDELYVLNDKGRHNE